MLVKGFLSSKFLGGFLAPALVLSLAACKDPEPMEPPAGNIALQQPTTASSVSRYLKNQTADKATDGDYTTWWESSNADDQWLQVDLGESQLITKAVVHWRRNQYPTKYEIQVSADGENWTVAGQVSDGDGTTDEIGLEATGRYLRLQSSSRRVRAMGMAIWELEVYGTPAAPNTSPVFTSDISLAEGMEGQAVSGSIAGSATDGDGDDLTYSLADGPDWLQVGATGDLSGTPGAGDTGDQSWTVQASDGRGGNATAQLTMTIMEAPNNPPAFANDSIDGGSVPATLSYTGSLQAADMDGDALTFSKTGGPDWLQVAADGALSGTPGGSDQGNNTFTVSVSDGEGGTDEATLSIAVTEKPNLPPAFSSSDFSAGGAVAASPFSSNIAGQASDADGDALTFSLVSGPAWLSLTADGALSGTPGTADTGTGQWSVAVTDGRGGQATATMTIIVGAKPNVPPTFSAGTIDGGTVEEASAVSGSIGGSAGDEDGDSLTYSKASGPAWLNVGSNGALSGNPGEGDIGLNTFTVAVSDGRGGSDTATLNISVTAKPNVPPAFSGTIDGGSLIALTSYSGSIAANASDSDGDALTFSKVSGPAWLNVAANGTLSGQPDESQIGDNTFTVSVSDGEASATTSLSIQVAPVPNQPPVLADSDGGSVPAQSAYTGSVASAGSDADGDALTFSKKSGPAWLSVATDGSLSGTPASADRGSNSFTIAVSDGEDSATATLTIDVTNLPPSFATASIDGGSLIAETAYSGSIAANGKDDDGDSLSYSKAGGPAWLTVSSDGTLGGTPGESDVGQSSFTVQVSDGTDSASATLNIDVLPVPNQPPVLVDSDGGSVEAQSSYSGSVADAASDADGDALTFTKVDGPAWLSVGADGSLSGTPGSADRGENTFTVQVSDGEDSASASLTIAVTNIPPVITGSLDGGSLIALTDYSGNVGSSGSDGDGDNLTWSIVSGPGWLSIGADGNLSGTPAESDEGDNAFTVQLSDGTDSTTASLSIQVLPVPNIPPVFTVQSLDGGSLTARAAYSGNIAGDASDEDGDNLSFSKVSGPAWLVVNADGSLGGTPAAADRGLNLFTVSVSDGEDQATATLSIDVRNTAPTISGPIDGGSADAGSAYAGNLAGSASDADGDSLSWTLMDGPAWLQVDSDGRLSGTPGNGDEGTNQFTVMASDGEDSATGTLSISVVVPLAPLSAEATAFLNQKGCLGCHNGPYAQAGLDLAVWPFAYADTAPNKTDDLVEIMDRVVAVTAPDAAVPMPPFGPRPTEAEHCVIKAARAAVAGQGGAPVCVSASSVTPVAYNKDSGTWSGPSNLDDRITVSWSPVAGAESYNVYRDDSSAPVATGVTGTSWDDTDVSTGGTELTPGSGILAEKPVYTYRISAVIGGVEGAPGAASNPGQADLTPEEFQVISRFLQSSSQARFDIPDGYVSYAGTIDGANGGQSTMDLNYDNFPSSVDLTIQNTGYDDYGIAVTGQVSGTILIFPAPGGTLPGAFTYSGRHNGYQSYVITVTNVDFTTGAIVSSIKGELYYNGKVLPFEAPYDLIP